MSNRNIADMFSDSAVRTTEETKEEQDKNNNIETLKQQNDNNNIDVNDNVNDNDQPEEPEKMPPSEQDDILDFLKVEQEKKVVGFHLDKDVRQAFQKVLGRKPQRGAQSELANRIFRDFFEKRGLL